MVWKCCECGNLLLVGAFEFNIFSDRCRSFWSSFVITTLLSVSVQMTDPS